MSDHVEARLRELEGQIAALTRRVFQLEQGRNVEPEAPPLPLHEQPVWAEPEVVVVEAPKKDWEGSVGTSWMNRIGVVLIVIGMVLFLGYAMTDMGPGGRIGLAAAAGVSMLAAGYWAEARGNWRPWSLGMIAGGFAVGYLTAYAAHAVEAAKVIPSNEAGVLLQTAIALAAIGQARKFGNETAAMIAFLGAFLGLLASDGKTLSFAGSLPLSIGGLWLSTRMQWARLSWGILIYSWAIAVTVGKDLGDSVQWGQPTAWLYFGLFSSWEIWRRTEGEEWWQPVWLLVNAGAFLVASLGATKIVGGEHLWRVLGLLALAGLVSSAVRVAIGVRREALSEALSLLLGCLWVADRIGRTDPLLASVLVLALAMTALAWNRRQPTLALTSAAELTLGVVSLSLMAELPESKKLTESPLQIRLALPQSVLAMVSLFAAGRWLTQWPWPSWLALALLAEVTLWTVPKTVGTILLACEAILAVAVGLYLNRRPIRLGGIALFAFSILKVFLYDLSELSTLPRILSFIVLGALLLGASWGYTRYRAELQKYL